MAALTRRGMTVQGFKSGPDFLDPGWHTALTGRPSRNLDLWMCGGSDRKRPDDVLAWQYLSAVAGADIVVAEGAMGLYDGLPGLSASCADVALNLGLPVLLVLDCRGTAATAAAVARGLASFRPDLPLLGAVATRVGSRRHADIIRRAFAEVPDIPLFGLLPDDRALTLPSRHLGLVQAGEALSPSGPGIPTAELAGRLARWLEDHTDLDDLLRRAAQVPPFLSGRTASPLPPAFPPPRARRVRIAVARDEAFTFWYPEHDALLAAAGGEPVPFSPLRDSGLPPEVRGLLLPGGYPELYARRLSANRSMLEAVRNFARVRPVHGECGGYLYLMESLETGEGERVSLTGCLPLAARMETRRSALGYREVTGLSGPWNGLTLRGHEFHYSRVTSRPDGLPALWISRSPGATADSAEPEGTALGRITGSYVHLSLLSHPLAASRLVDACADLSPSGGGSAPATDPALPPPGASA